MSVLLTEQEEIAPELEPTYAEALIYLNRLSDYLFTAARHANALDQIPDILWKK